MFALTCRATLAAALLLATALTIPAAAKAEDILVFAAASLKNALDVIATRWENETGNSVVVSYGASPALAKQIQEGAPADIFISASKGWMDTLAEGSLIKPESRKDLLGNTLVLVAASKDAAPVEIVAGFDLAALLGDGKLSMAMVDSVPAGQYGKEALEKLGVWSMVEASVAQSENVRAALMLVATGEAPYGIVYASDALADDKAGDKVAVVGTFPDNSHKAIVYPAAVLTASTGSEAQAFLDNLSSLASDAVFESQGFIVLK